MGVATLLTREEFLALPDADDYELIDGELKEREMGAFAADTGLLVGHNLLVWNEREGLGRAFGDSAPLDIFGRNYVPRADGGWISFARLGARRLPPGTLQVPPELAFEIMSPGNKAVEVEAKVTAYLDAGIDEVWVVYPEARRVHVFRRGHDPRILREGDILASDVLPGFSAPIASLFPPVE